MKPISTLRRPIKIKRGLSEDTKDWIAAFIFYLIEIGVLFLAILGIFYLVEKFA